jgi:Uma2 family endonuclease
MDHLPPPATLPMTADTFIAWAIEHDVRGELVGGQVVPLPPERAAHALVKARAWQALITSVQRAGLPAQVFPDGMAVPVAADEVYEPDALLRCGAPVADEATRIDDPVVIVEVLSPSTTAVDTGAKLIGYFRLPSVRHYLVIDVARRVVIHHARADGTLTTRIVTEGELTLEPPGLALPVADLFTDLAAQRPG